MAAAASYAPLYRPRHSAVMLHSSDIAEFPQLLHVEYQGRAVQKERQTDQIRMEPRRPTVCQCPSETACLSTILPLPDPATPCAVGWVTLTPSLLTPHKGKERRYPILGPDFQKCMPHSHDTMFMLLRVWFPLVPPLQQENNGNLPSLLTQTVEFNNLCISIVCLDNRARPTAASKVELLSPP